MHKNSDKFDHLIALVAMKCVEEEAEELKNADTSNVEFDPFLLQKEKADHQQVQTR